MSLSSLFTKGTDYFRYQKDDEYYEETRRDINERSREPDPVLRFAKTRIRNPAKRKAKKAKQKATSWFSSVKEKASNAYESAKQTQETTAAKAKKKTSSWFSSMKQKASDAYQSTKQAATDTVTKASTKTRQASNTFANQTKNAASTIADKLEDAQNKAYNARKNFDIRNVAKTAAGIGAAALAAYAAHKNIIDYDVIQDLHADALFGSGIEETTQQLSEINTEIQNLESQIQEAQRIADSYETVQSGDTIWGESQDVYTDIQEYLGEDTSLTDKDIKDLETTIIESNGMLDAEATSPSQDAYINGTQNPHNLQVGEHVSYDAVAEDLTAEHTERLEALQNQKEQLTAQQQEDIWQKSDVLASAKTMYDSAAITANYVTDTVKSWF